MTIKTIHVKNFKSFKELRVDLGKFNVLIGANASGKSNLIRVFEFLRDIARHGLDNAISLQGGSEYLTNLNFGTAENLSIQVVFSQERESGFFIIATSKTSKTDLGVAPLEVTYGFSIAFAKKGVGFEVADDRLAFRGEFRTFERDGQGQARRPLGLGSVAVSRDGDKVSVKPTLPEGLSSDEYEISPWFLGETVSARSLILVHFPFFIGPAFGNIAIYDFDPKLPKKATPITGRADLEEDGSNLAIVLKNIIEDRGRKRKLRNFLGDLLPFVTGLEVEKFADKSLLFNLRETYAKKQSLPASLISDGTINVTALIAALYFEKKPVAIIEEPERNIHPSLISKVVAMMKDASQGKQVIVTTHNPEVVRHADIGDVLLVSRNGEGFSTITKPSENNEVKVFLQNEMGLEELFVENLLHA
ncbi:MAG TPA: AAA family ATPase [Terriglobia bacterium]|nr:AAA family ATPase [Terriglobia bacterium]